MSSTCDSLERGGASSGPVAGVGGPLTALLLLGCFGPALVGLATRTLELSGYYDHLLVVIGASTWSFWKRRDQVVGAPTVWGWPWLVLGLWLNVVGRVEGVLLPQVAGFILASLGLVLVRCGRSGARVVAFPLAFLLMALPLPRVAIDATTGGLRSLVTTLAVEVLQGLGLPVARSGSRILLEGTIAEVGPACSGLQGALAFVVLGALVARETTGFWRQGVVLLAALPVAIFANLIRVMALTGLAAVAPALSRQQWAHQGLGLLVYAVGGVALLGLKGALGGPEAVARAPQPHEPDLRRSWPGSDLLIAAGACAALFLPDRWPGSHPGPLPPVTSAAGWFGRPIELPYRIQGASYVRYVREGQPAFVDLYTIRGAGADLDAHLPADCFPGEGFAPSGEGPRLPELPGVARVEVYRGPGGESYLTVHWYSQGDEWIPPPDHTRLRIRSLARRLLLKPSLPIMLVRVVTPFDTGAEARLHSFVRDVVPRLGPGPGLPGSTESDERQRLE